ncbi:MAG TPA: hypothetical protein VNY34_00300 [Solirubrobacteraceae bacterium]|nr:hypothetical protein [Solirubrobacteraceae bacterium]
MVVLIITLAATGGASPRRASDPFAWLRPASPPEGWNVARTPDGAALAYPPGWTAIKTDPGTASVALRGGGGRIDGYLNVTPKQGAETLANWSRFRPQKNRTEGARNVRLLAATSNARFRSARGSCVIDAYTTSLTRYREIACLVAGPRSSEVVVAAAPTRLWQEQSAALERAVSSFAV